MRKRISVKHLIAILVVELGLLALGYVAMADSNIISIKDAWARASPNGATIGVAYMTVINTGKADDRLLDATTPIAAKVEFHWAANANGVMQMSELSTIAIPVGAPTTLKPGAMHMMMIGLKRPFIRWCLILRKPGESA